MVSVLLYIHPPHGPKAESRCRSFNKKQSDFESLKQYNDYLEEVEDISKPGELAAIPNGTDAL